MGTLVRTTLAFLILVGSIATAGHTAAQTYPAKPIRVIVTAAPGGSDDFMGRLIAQGMSDLLGQQVVVENRPGGGALIGREFVARAVPDGYTLLLAGSTMAAIPALRPSLKLNALRDYSAVRTTVANFQNLLVVHPSVPAKSVKELIVLAKAQPGKLTFASSGSGQGPHLSAELFKSMAKVDILHIPYQGSAPAYVDILSGRVDMIFGVITAALQQVRAGKVRPLGVTGAKRATMLPEVPTIAEAALPGYEYPGWYGIFGPAGISGDIVAKLSEAISKVVTTPDTRKRMLQVGMDPETGTPEQLREKLKASTDRFAKLVRDAGIKIE